MAMQMDFIVLPNMVIIKAEQDFKQVRCLKCDCACKNMKQLHKHNRRYHLAQTTFRIPVDSNSGARKALVVKRDQDGKIRCPTCKAPYNRTTSLYDHMVQKCMAVAREEIINRKEPADFQGDFKCSQCPRTLLTKTKLREHVTRNHSDSTTVKIPSGPLGELTSVTLTKDNDGKFKCPICSSLLATKGSVDSHVVRHSLSSKESVCKSCDQVFPSEIKLQTHFLDYHREEVDVGDIRSPGSTIRVKRSQDGCLACPYCFKPNRTTNGFRHHVRLNCSVVRMLDPIQNYKCNACNVTYMNRGSFIKHKAKYHSKSTIFVHKLPSGQQSKMTVKRNSNGKYVCPVCTTNIIQTDNFRLHFLKSCIESYNEVKVKTEQF